MLGRLGVGAGQQEDVVGVLRRVVHTFWPLTTHSSPSSSALVLRLARSQPASGSLNPWHQAIVPIRMARDDLFLLLFGSPLQERRSHQGVAEEVAAQRRPGPGELLVQHHLLEQRQPLASVLGRPAGADPSAGERASPSTPR